MSKILPVVTACLLATTMGAAPRLFLKKPACAAVVTAKMAWVNQTLRL